MSPFHLLLSHRCRRLRFSSDADIVRLTNARITITITVRLAWHHSEDSDKAWSLVTQTTPHHNTALLEANSNKTEAI